MSRRGWGATAGVAAALTAGAAGLAARRRRTARRSLAHALQHPDRQAARLPEQALAPAEVPAHLVLEETFLDVPNGWQRVERWLDTTPGFRQESYPSDGRGDQDGDRLRYFGGVRQPFSGRFLMYEGPESRQQRRRPVLLVHGANDNPDRAWANPGEGGAFGCGALVCPNQGLMQALAAAGHSVFAIGFAHKQGDNLLQAQLIGDAITLVRARTGADTVDVVAWSKGVTCARAYLAGVGPTWGRGYGGDVGRFISLGGPNGGYDYPFAHGWAHNFSIYPEWGGTINAPSPHSSMRFGLLRRRHPEFSIDPADGYDNYPGQRQMLARCDATYGIDTTQVDWWTTYAGGRGSNTVGRGIDSAARGSLIPTLQTTSTPASVATYLLAGASPTIVGIFNEDRGPSDGVVFISSALDPTGVGNLVDTAVVPVANHLQLGWSDEVAQIVLGWLG